MKKLSFSLFIACLLAACNASPPVVPVSSPSPSASAQPLASPSAPTTPQASTQLGVEVDMRALKAEDQALLRDQLIVISAALADQPTLSPTPLPAMYSPGQEVDLTPTAPAGAEVTTQPVWGPLKARAGQTLVFENLPAQRPIRVEARLNYRVPGKLNCEQGAVRTFVASGTTDQASDGRLKLSLSENTLSDLSACVYTHISGSVREPNGQPVRDARVVLRSLNAFVPFEKSMQTDAEGNYSFLVIPPGIQYEIQVEKAGYFPANRTEVPRDNTEGNLNFNRYDFRLQPAN
ncbi:MAG: carboxypeptidase-like regulatory domain-containing protein [Candidatus Sericytochromatia bacterium]